MDFQKELISEFDREVATTRKVLDAIPEDADFTWKAHPKSMTLSRLAGHTAETPGDWAIHTLTTDKLEWSNDPSMAPFQPTSKTELLERFDRDTATARKALADIEPSAWDRRWTMSAGDQVWIDGTKYDVYRQWVMSHMIHHRAQLGVYLRLLGARIPGCYGPSADDMSS